MKKSLLGGLVLLTASWAGAQPEIQTALEARLDFEDGKTVFQTFGDTGKVSLTREPANVKQGRSALRFDYQVAAKQLNALFLPGDVGAAANVKSVSFWLRTDYATNLVVVLQEKDSGRHLAVCHSPGNVWLKVELGLADFSLATDKNDPTDGNGKLDMDMVEAVAIADFNQIFAQSGDENLKKIIGVKTGPHSLFIDDFWASNKPLTAPQGVDLAEPLVIDQFVNQQVQWAVLGNVQVKRVTEKEMADNGGPEAVRNRGLEAGYKRKQGTIIGFMRRIAPGKLKDMSALKLTLACEKASTIMVQLEEISGGKYNAIVQVPGDSRRTEIRLLTKLFGKADDSKDDNDRLDLDQVKQIAVLDATGLLGQAEGDNLFWISDVRVEK